jgi:xanthine dehydrogenase accessory factor
MTTDLLSRAERLRAERTPYVLATVVRAQRPTSAKAGDRALILPDGTIEGFVGGACAEATVRLQGLRLLRTGESTLLRITPADTATQVSAGAADVSTVSDVEGLVVVDNTCLSGGTLEIFLEPVLPPVLVHVFGSAPIARALERIGVTVGYDVRLTNDPDAPVPPGASAVIVASHGRDEERVLAAALEAGVPYVALVASRRRGATLLATLGEAGQRVRSPAGLDIGARTPAEVALSVLAEMVSLRVVTHPPPDAPESVPTAPVGAGPQTAVDPVCGMTVAATPTSLRLEHGGKTWYFCGPGCRQAFADDPGRYSA